MTTLAKTLAQQLKDQTAAVAFRSQKFGVRRRLKPDQRAAAAEPFQAEPSRLVASKVLLDTSATQFRAVTEVLKRARRYWKSMTVFYPERGIRLIRRDLIDLFEAQMREFRVELDSVMGTLLSAYKDMKKDARTALGGLYHPGDYPDPDTLADEFQITWSYPSVTPPDYLRELNPALYEQQQALVAARFEEAMATAQAALAGELQDLIGHLVERLTPGADGKRKSLNDKALTGLREFVDRFQQVAVHTSPELDALIKQAEQIAKGVDVAALKASPEGQQHLFTDLSQVKSVLDKMLIDAPTRKIDLEEEDE